jgi:hypothetical protein
MTSTEAPWTILSRETQGDLIRLLLEVAEYAGPGYRPIDADWQGLYLLGEIELVTYGPEPLGTYGTDGREEYGSIVHLTPQGKEEVEALRWRPAA